MTREDGDLAISYLQPTPKAIDALEQSNVNQYVIDHAIAIIVLEMRNQ